MYHVSDEGGTYFIRLQDLHHLRQHAIRMTYLGVRSWLTVSAKTSLYLLMRDKLVVIGHVYLTKNGENLAAMASLSSLSLSLLFIYNHVIYSNRFSSFCFVFIRWFVALTFVPLRIMSCKLPLALSFPLHAIYLRYNADGWSILSNVHTKCSTLYSRFTWRGMSVKLAAGIERDADW